MNRFRLDITNWLVAVIALAVLSAATGHWWSPGIEPHFTYLPEGAPGHARSLNELLLRPDVIAVGTVVRSGTGRSVGEAIAGVPRSQTHLEFVETVLAVESVLAGDIPGETVRIETEKDGAQYRPDWRTHGTRVLVFLWLKRDEASAGQFYRLISEEGALVVVDERLRATRASAVTQPLDDLTLTELATLVGDARETTQTQE